MKTTLLFLLLMLPIICSAQNVTIPDANFKNALIEQGVDTNDDGEISTAEAQAVTYLDLIAKNISDMTGIEAFTNLVSLNCDQNQLTSLNVASNTSLQYLNCSENQLTSLDVSNNPALIVLGCFVNQLTSLDVSNNPALEMLGCWHNQITSLNLSNNTALTGLYCSYNPITSLDVSNNTALIYFGCYHTLLSRLDISKNILLEWLDISGIPTLHQVCVWVIPFPPANLVVNTDDSPNVTFSTVCVSPCITKEEFVAGEGFRVQQNLSYFPGDKALDGFMQRGDVIGLSARVTDKDYIRQLCICRNDTTSKLWGPYSDNVYYEWTLEGNGKLLIPDNQSGRVFYELPVCITDDYTATVTLTVKNGERSLAADEEITGSFTINVRACPKRGYTAGSTADWCSSCLKVSLSTDELSNGSDGEMATKDDADCDPEEIAFYQSFEINVVGGIITKGEFCKPDYAVMLTVDANDPDLYIMKCKGEAGCESQDSVWRTFYDPLKYEWSIVSGKGEFPLGNLGKSVVFHKSRSEGATLKCTISNIDSKSNGDRPIVVMYEVDAAEKPKAFVGLGDDEATFTVGKAILEWWHERGVYAGRNSGFLKTAESMKNALETAGYEVGFWEHVSGIDIEHAVQDPIYQAVVIVGHGGGGGMNMAGTDPLMGTIQYTSAKLKSANKETYKCAESPRIRDLQLIGCEALRGSWSDGLHCGARLFGWRTSKKVATLRYYAYWTYKPLPPVNLSLE